ncbi:unnamed protein product [Parascedosporium putredinis]|uniref:Disease resistance R13L4/SHOC-2-like LRR domain-containing protein n=1 Tax=Parascedosporium putredinis TaxID=1442378 RepID=A0A9P1M8P3_9PEZI|nr:unnamed protein product [Parascedosporium putredinis]CAI7989320.1 unnamed protein product [Parascedosporium putredinis]
MDRPSGPLGAATQSTGRSLPDLPTQSITMRRPVGAPRTRSPPPLSTLQCLPCPYSQDPKGPFESGPLLRFSRSPGAHASEQGHRLCEEAMQNALQENEAQAQRAEGGTTNAELKPGVTIDLSRKGIRELPEEVVDVIKHELERLALSHNQLTAFPTRFSECTSLRYLNVRNNQIKDFPLPLCDLKSLEILDLGRNKLRILPPEIVRLTSLKVLSVQRNRIRELPLCLADMASLQVLKLDGNDIMFPPPEVFQVPATTPPSEGVLRENDVTELAVTAHIKRVASGRFPIKVNGSEVADIRSPASMRPPPIPTRSHYRGLSQQSTTMRRTNVMPLTIGNERPESRSRRMAVMSKKGSDLGTLDETQANNRFSHYRGLSHGSAMQGPGANANLADKSPASPAEPYLQRPIYVRRLSILPERRRESKVYDPTIETAKGILYSVFQIHPMIQMLMSLTNDGSAKRSSLEIVFYNTNSHVEELEQAIQKHDPLNGDDEASAYHDNENVHRACQTLVSAYTHVCTLLAGNIDTFVDNGDPRYIRTLLVLLYNSIMELRRSSELVMRSLPGLVAQLSGGLRNAIQNRERNGITEEVIRAWRLMVSKATTAVQQTETLKARMSLIKLKEPGIRTQTAFWNVCSNFLRSWSDFGAAMKYAVGQHNLPIGADARAPPTDPPGDQGNDGRYPAVAVVVYPTRVDGTDAHEPDDVAAGARYGGGPMQQMPMTPQSAALGPAAQATIPSTPQSASFSSAFSGNVFERADALISYGGLAMPSRTGTMTSSGGPGPGGPGGLGMTGSSMGGSMSSSSSMSMSMSMSMQDGSGAMTPATMLSPGSSFSSARLNGTRMAF